MLNRARMRPAPSQPVNRRGAVLLALGGAIGASAAVGGIAVAVSRPSHASRAAAPGAREAAVAGEAAGPLVVDKPLIDLGRVPLDVVVPVAVTLTNRSERTVRLGNPTAEALEGC